MVLDQVLIRLNKSFKEVSKAHNIVGASFLLVGLNHLEVFLDQVLINDSFDLHDDFTVLLAVALIQTFELSISYETLTVGEEERFEYNILEEVPGEENVHQDKSWQ